jgi:hypothetical protein
MPQIRLLESEGHGRVVHFFTVAWTVTDAVAGGSSHFVSLRYFLDSLSVLDFPRLLESKELFFFIGAYTLD